MSLTLPLITIIKPKERKEPFDDPDWTFDLKYDGYRGVLTGDKSGCRIRSKTGLTLTQFDRLCVTVIDELQGINIILDGEVVIENDRGGFSRHALQRYHKRPVEWEHAIQPKYVAFDILWYKRKDLRQLPLLERRKYLDEVIPKDSHSLLRVVSQPETGRDMFASVEEHNFEGMVAKPIHSPYERWVTWYKIKNPNYKPS